MPVGCLYVFSEGMSVFSHTTLNTPDLIWRNVCLGLLYIFFIGSFKIFIVVELHEFFCIFWKWLPCWSLICKCFFPFCRLSFCFIYNFLWWTRGFSESSVGKESTCNAGDSSSILGLGRSPGEGIGYPLQYSWASLVAQLVRNLPAMRETWFLSLGWEDPLEKERIPTPVFWPREFCGLV